MSQSHTLSLILIAATTLAACSGGSDPKTAPVPETGQKSENVVTGKTIATTPDVPIEQMLANRVAGVTLDRTSDGTLMVRIRGTTSWSSDNQQPLYIVDGVPFTPGAGGALTGINAFDIEKIEVLKDAAHTSMYGSRGANGVIIIKMKKP